ncbi:MAG: ADP-forming succinate--CoA ligase subunit beta [Mariprofundaceae bacterium]|nr:ADP-forming succinate--CoA ligase subunit beta [Mariprofundaceae bacterium]
MNLHEYQAKEILHQHGVFVPKGVLIEKEEEVKLTLEQLSSSRVVVKAQVHAGGRGKAGGVKLCEKAELEQTVANMLGSHLMTAQTGHTGKEVHKVWVEEAVNIAHEYYLSILLDRSAHCLSFMLSTAGGMDIEETAEHQPAQIVTVNIEPNAGLQAWHMRQMAFFLGLDKVHHRAFHVLIHQLYQTFIDTDADMLELNPLVLTQEGTFMALDAKVSIDDNALYRQKDIAVMADLAEENPIEVKAAAYGLNYISLDGDIGCMVNGAGLAMATMDMIHLKGSEPANFLDVGGGVSEETVAHGFRLLLEQAHLKAILVNIFGGIVRCDLISLGLIEALKTHHLHIPLVMRLVGTHEEEGRALIKQAGIPVLWANDLDEAASLAVATYGEKI